MKECIFFVLGAFGYQQRLANPCWVPVSAVSSFIDVFGTFLLVKLNNRICMTILRHGQLEEVDVITGVWRSALESLWF